MKKIERVSERTAKTSSRSHCSVLSVVLSGTPSFSNQVEAMRPDAIVLHHSLTSDETTVAWSAIRNFHRSYRHQGRIISPDKALDLIAQGQSVEKPWQDIGYHFGIEQIEGHQEILAGRMMTEPGAHCTQQGMNRRSLGICFIGNFDDDPPPEDQWRLGLRLVRSLMELFDITLGRIYGHRELASYKTCPGKRFDLERFRRELLEPDYRR